MTTETKTISLIPSWKAAASIYIMALQNGSPVGVEAAQDGILEMATMIDGFNELVHQLLDNNDMDADTMRAVIRDHMKALKEKTS